MRMRVSRAPLRMLRLVLATAVLASCFTGRRQLVPPPPADENTLGPGDVFQVRVFGEADLSQEYRVADDGTIDFPFLVRVRVQGLNTSQVADVIRTQLLQRQILRDPQVSVNVREVNSRRISVFGQVQHPGTFPFQHGMTIVQAITLAGGFTQLAAQGATRLTRRNRAVSGGQRTYNVPVNEILEDRASNVLLAPGDVIYVPESAL